MALARGGAAATHTEEAKEGTAADSSVRGQRAEHPQQVWAIDFQVHFTADGRRLRFLNVID